MHRIAAAAVVAAALPPVTLGCGASRGRPPLGDAAPIPRDLAPPPVDSAGDDLAAHDLAPADLAAPDLAAPADLTALADCDLACDTPPATACDRNLIRSWSSPGRCLGGGCVYPSTTTACAYGCWSATCTAQLAWIGSTAAFITAGRQLNLFADNAPAGATVSAITQTWPEGAAADVHAVYTVDSFATRTDVALQFDKLVGNNEQWFVVLPVPAAVGTTTTWYLYVDGYDGSRLYDSGGGRNFSYTAR
jgi:hypothetical protein